MALFQRIKPSLSGTEPDRDAAISPELRSAGAELREERQTLGLDLGEVAAALKIKPAYLAAIEEGRTDRLPGAAYAVGFIRAYSTYLGLDSGEILRRFKIETSGFDTKPDLSFPMPLAERSMPGGGTVVMALILAICGYGAWYYWSTAERARPERVTEVPAALLAAPPKPPKTPAEAHPAAAAPLSAGSPTAPGSAGSVSPEQDVTTPRQPQQQQASEASSAPPVVAGSAPASLPPASPERNSAAPGATTQTAANPPLAVAPASAPPATPPSPTEALAAPAPEGETARVYGEADGPSRIMLRANADSWIQIRGPDRAVLFTGLLKRGDSYRVPDRPGLSMRAGNAGGLDVVVDGKAAAPLGPMGAVRNVSLDPQALAARAAAQN